MAAYDAISQAVVKMCNLHRRRFTYSSVQLSW